MRTDHLARLDSIPQAKLPTAPRALPALSAAATFVLATVMGPPATVVSALAQDDRAAAAVALETAVVEAISQAEKSVVAISQVAEDAQTTMREDLEADFFLRQLQSGNIRQPQPRTTGTGVIIDASGLILTQYSLVRPDQSHVVTTIDGKSYPAVIKAADPRSGLAVIEVEASGLPAISIGRGEDLRKGQFVIAIGNPHAIVSDGQPSSSWGIVSNLARRLGDDTQLGDSSSGQPTLHSFGTLIQTDARLTFGTGGGLLVNLRGEMVGLNTSAAVIAGHEQPAGYSIPMDEIFRRIVDALKAGREVEYGLLGIQFNPDPSIAVQAGIEGVAVSAVLGNGPADRAGLQAGDVVTHVADQPVPNPDRLQLVVGNVPPDNPTTVKYQRGGRPALTEVVLAKYPVAGRKEISNRLPGWRGIHVDYTTAVQNPRSLGDDAALSEEDPDGCVIVVDVEHGSPAWNSGVRPGMYISHVGDERVSTPAEFRAAVDGTDGRVDVRFTAPSDNPAAGADGDNRQIPDAN